MGGGYHQTPLRIIMAFILISSNFYNPKALLRKLKVIMQYRRSQELIRTKEIQQECHKKQITHTAESTGENPSYVKDIIEKWFEKKPLPFIPLCKRRGVEMALERWYKKGIILGAFSDYPVEDKLNALGISRFFTTMVSVSDPEVNGFKPNTNGFALSAMKMGIDPSEILYVGDREEVDGIGASNAGMQVVILKSIFEKRVNCKYSSFSSFYDLMKII
jgi:Predicted hydrolase (HAD superfamily)